MATKKSTVAVTARESPRRPEVKRPLRFTDEQVRQLSSRGLSAEQVERLRARCDQAVGQGWFDSRIKRPTKEDLRTAALAIKRLAADLADCVRAAPGDLRMALYEAAYEAEGRIEVAVDVNDMLKQLACTVDICNRYLNALKTYKATGAAPSTPIALIAMALEGTRIRASASPTSKFVAVTAICYDAMGGRDPERAIKNFLKERRRPGV